jgi:hypothetical protein
MKTINLSHLDIPSREELLNLLSMHFEPFGYKCSLFGYGYGKSIMVRKNIFVGARIFMEDKKGSPGKPWLIGFPFVLLIGNIFSMYKNITNETFSFLSETYQG